MTLLALSAPALDAAMQWLPLITPKKIDGVDTALATVLGWVLWGVSVLSLIGLLSVAWVGFESYRHNQGENIMEKAKKWIVAAILGAYAKDIVRMFFPSFSGNVVALPIPGMEGPVRDVLGNIIWVMGWAAFACILFLAGMGFIAFKNDGVSEFVSKFFWFIVGSFIATLATNIAGAFFPSTLSL